MKPNNKHNIQNYISELLLRACMLMVANAKYTPITIVFGMYFSASYVPIRGHDFFKFLVLCIFNTNCFLLGFMELGVKKNLKVIQ
jgi:hypothetical protein